MSVRSMTLVLAGAVAFAPLALAAQNHAVPRGGGGGGAPSGGGQPAVHSSGGGSSSSGSGGSSGGGSSSSSSSGAHTPSLAERRHPHAGTGSGYHGGYYPGYGGGGYWGGYYPYYPYYPYWGWYYPGFYGSYWWPYGGWGWNAGYWGNPWGWGGGAMYHSAEDETGSVRVLVDPSDARVYVDGYYAGTVDDFDGLFQRLHVAPGQHEITLKLEGYQSHRMRVYVSPDTTLKLQYKMQKGTGESFADLAANVPQSVLERDRERMRQHEQEQAFVEGEPGGEQAMANAGTLRLEIRPGDASVYVDGAFRGTGREAAALRLAPGRHRLEVVRPGYRTSEREVEVGPGQSNEVTIELEKNSI
ncbi:MAG TPA: PEGA domain-containing protein [Vicinamibacteria bacterium]|nr:PEGA domain-containing protein [Vicinamibacteria bacterium]